MRTRTRTRTRTREGKQSRPDQTRMLFTSLETSSSSSFSYYSLPLLTVTVPASPIGLHFLTVVPTIKSIHYSQSPHSVLVYTKNALSKFRKYYYYSNLDQTFLDGDGEGAGSDHVQVQIEKLGNNSRRIYSKIRIHAPLQLVWNILTDYERLSDFIPGLALSQLLYKNGNHARLFQVGQQNLAFGFKLNAKGIVDCYENDLESLPFGEKRVIKFKMIEGDFQLFEGEWSIEQFDKGRCEDGGYLQDQEIHTSLSYWVDVKPKPWLPVRLVESMLCDEIKMNLMCIRVEAHKGSSTPC